MELTKKQAEKLEDMDIVTAAQEAREEASRLLNDQGFAILSLAVANFIAEIVEHPDKLVKEFAH